MALDEESVIWPAPEVAPQAYAASVTASCRRQTAGQASASQIKAE
jgi:hypothetical protein